MKRPQPRSGLDERLMELRKTPLQKQMLVCLKAFNKLTVAMRRLAEMVDREAKK